MPPRIPPLAPPYAPEVKAALDKWMPPGTGAPPLALFRTLARNEGLSERMRPLGAHLLGRGRLPARVRELLILRTSFRTGAEYEWGVHATAFSEIVGLDDAALQATCAREPAGDDAPILRFVDELCDTSTVSDATWAAMAARFGAEDLLEMIAVVGFYHLIAFMLNAVGIEREPWARRFPAGAGALVE
jgi:4-carboxymuconolactone decarboxylase